MTPFISRVSTIRSQRRGGAPQASRVPVPRGTTARPSAAAARMTALASSRLAGAATKEGCIPATESSGPAGLTRPQATPSASEAGAAPGDEIGPTGVMSELVHFPRCHQRMRALADAGYLAA